ncbi:MAG TPA: hypothetical protein VMO47_01375 [Rhodothermales bacterium]|nr:hypothetical protein [Rhodothermales bacterium]
MTHRFSEVVVYSLALFLGCRSSGEAGETKHREAPTQLAVPVPPDFEMTFGEGGGFGGGWYGHTIRADGSVFAWRGPVAGANLDSLGILDPDTLGRLWQHIEEIGFFSDSVDESGNITAFVRITGDGQEARSSWIPGVESIEPPRNATEALYRRTRATINRLFR